LGLIITDIENPYFPQLVRSVEDASRAAGYTVLLCNAAEDPVREASYLDLLVDRRVDGLIIAASSIGARQGEWLTAPPIPVVLVNTEVPDSGLPTITSDNAGGGRLATEHLLALGHRRFGYLMPPPRNVDAVARLAGCRGRSVPRASGGRPDRSSTATPSSAAAKRRRSTARARPGHDRDPRLQRPDGDRGAPGLAPPRPTRAAGRERRGLR
jgi:DNA-binding LacI/PurR family transcriptional regulator